MSARASCDHGSTEIFRAQRHLFASIKPIRGNNFGEAVNQAYATYGPVSGEASDRNARASEAGALLFLDIIVQSVWYAN